MNRLLAKSTGETLAEHTIRCLRAAAALLNSLGPSGAYKADVETDVLLAVAFHDLGKAAAGFQSVVHGDNNDWNGKRHEALSAALVSSFANVSAATVLAVLTHHKCIPGDGLTSSISSSLHREQLYVKDSRPSDVWLEMVREWKNNELLFQREWSEIRAQLPPRVRSLADGFESRFLPLRLDNRWLARGSAREGQRQAIPFHERYHASLVRGLTISADHLGSAHRVPSPVPRLFEFQILKKPSRGFQRRIASTHGSALLRAPTGSGKTEAALLWAQTNQRKNGRLFYVLPYTASINAMYKRLGPGFRDEKGIFGKKNVGLLHSNATAALYAMLARDGDPCSLLDKQQNASALSQLAREMWFPIRVCTPHQILRYVLRGRGWETMLSEFPGASFIFDEIHAYNPRIVGLILATARLLKSWGTESLFLSATLPDFLAELITKVLGELPQVEPDPTDSQDALILNRKRHILHVCHGTVESNLDQIIDKIRAVESTLIVCNHVKTAQQVFSRVRRIFGTEARLVHGRFNHKDRMRIENNLISAGLPKVLVTTQVVEVSLNLDFEQAFSEPAPIDALIQRMGRVNRGGGLPRPASVVVFDEQVSRHRLYCQCKNRAHDTQCRVRRSIDALQRLRNPLSESDLVKAASDVYSGGYEGDDEIAFEEGVNHPDLVNFERNLLAGAHQEWVQQVVDNADGRAEVLPKGLADEYEEKKRRGLWIEANMLLVPARLNSVRRFLDMSKEPWVVDRGYSSVLGLES